jgi:uncharacterized membrane-anchored protein
VRKTTARPLLAATSLYLCMSGAALAQSRAAQNELAGMHWRAASNVALATSHSTIRNLPGFVLVTGQEAQHLRQLVDLTMPDIIEADAYSQKSEIVYAYMPTDYISSDDWPDINPDELLRLMRANDASDNRGRLARGEAALTVVGWVQPPTLNNDTHTVSWIIDCQASDGRKVLNAVAMKLGRAGIEHIVWIGDPKHLTAPPSDLLMMGVNAHVFDPGARYEDYRAGTDRPAGYGVAGLVASALGVMLVKASVAATTGGLAAN